MLTRPLLAFAVLSAAFLLSCSGGDNPIAPPPPPPPPPLVTTIQVQAPASGMVGDTVVVGISATNAISCTAIVTSGATLLNSNGCISYRIILGQTGTAIVSATATGSSGTVNAEAKQISILPRPVLSTKDTLSVTLYSPEESDSPPQGMRIRVIWTKSGVKDSVEIAMSGRSATIEVPIALDSIHTRFEGDSRYSLREQVLYRGDYLNKQVVIILEPRNWKIRSAQFAGQVLPVSLALGLTNAGASDPIAYLGLIKLAKATGGERKVLFSWPAEKLPIRVAVIWSKSFGFSRESDSAHFTNKVFPAVNQYLGVTTFIPGQILGDTVPDGMMGVILQDNPPPGRASGAPAINWATGEIPKATITLPNRLYLDPVVVGAIVHELMHALGYGHTCGWVSVMYSDAPECSGKSSNTLTAMDIAMYEFATAIRDMAKKKNTVFAFN